ncbi:exonuclease subunit SbcD [Actinomyces sp. oral taxon 448]|uniref:metallophosphoesterase family protein n=1 Tax=Actinomyces sp. oral taxon 448 TaxID=712124 RepID=UPI0025BC1071|nr:exonuclease subunit SbcD [Actinomyces sp. oral taxon 448]
MRILHTSDWHLGRTFHGRVLDDAQAIFADHLVELARTEAVDAVVISGDVYDRAIPPTDSVLLLDDTLRRLVGATRVVLTPGNHDSAQRLGFGAGLMRRELAIRTRTAEVDRPVIIPTPDGGDGLYVYALPYLDPDAARQSLPPLLADRLGESPETPEPTSDGGGPDPGSAASGNEKGRGLPL